MTGAQRERGSIIIALAVVLVLSGLALAAAARTVAALGSARAAQDDAAATAAAGTGVADALFALDNGAVAPDATFPLTIGPVSGSAFTWTATAQTGGTVDITAVGTVNGRRHTIDAVATRPAAYPWVLRTTGSLVIDGVDYVSGGSLAAAGPLVLRNGAGGGTQQDLLGAGASCSGCTAPQATTWTSTTPAPSGATLPCPGNGTITSLTAGTYTCAGDVTFSGTVPVSGDVVIYMYGSGTLHLDGATVNGGGDPSDLIVHKVGAGVVEPGDDPTAGHFTGVIDAPAASLRSALCDFHVHGALVLGSLACSATDTGPHLVYDSRLGRVWSDRWTVTGTHDA